MSDAETPTKGTHGTPDPDTNTDTGTDADGRVNVAIACQGGGSHTAFTAGVVAELCRQWDDERYRLVGLSGTSGGAFNALVAWYGLVTADGDRAAELLEAVWRDLAATDPFDRAVNDWTVFTSRVEATGFPVAKVSPYFLPAADDGQARLKRVLEGHIDFDAIPDLCARDAPRLVVGTVDVHGGAFETFVDREVTADAVLASAAVPELFRGVELHGHLHWDGLFSQNPPVNDLMGVPAADKPDEIWIVQINPQTYEGTPVSVETIADRRNELSGNLSLNQEVRFIETVNAWVAAGQLSLENYSHTTVRRIELDEDFHFSTKLDRRPAFLGRLIDLGRNAAQGFLVDLDAERASTDADETAVDDPDGTAPDGEQTVISG